MSLIVRWRLHPLHLYLVCSYLGLDDLTLPLEGPAYGRTRRQLGEVAQLEAGTLRKLGILVDDEVPAELARALRVLTKPYLWVDSLWFPEFGGDAAWRTVAALTDGGRVVLGVQEPGETGRFGGTLTVEVHEKAGLSEVLLATLPPAPPGNRGRAQVPESSLRADAEPPQAGFLREVVAARGSGGDRLVELYRRIGTDAHVRAGQFAASIREPDGRRRRSAVVRWFDNAEPDGRYLDHHERGATGERMHSLTPADARAVRGQIDTLIASIRG
ncbi:ESX secretion-associated protein EspG [Saccharopolyspora gloriosae]|uniref:ESX secretion-associated protein EspG n=1 Tax=Saccharopolyspora gloriosae TaxID=455344 RepID=UPI001FB5A96D|nr:ESX secretion-associated protein EspG [Saccharopolyspora gloriosae]